MIFNLLSEDENIPDTSVRLKIFGGANNVDQFQFDVKSMNKGQRIITIGRDDTCDITLDDKLLSKI